MAKKCHLSESTVVVAGGHDQGCAALGSGMIDSSIAEDSIGTCECIALMLPDDCNKKILKDLQMPYMPFPLPGKYFTALEITTCGALTNWACDTLFRDKVIACKELGTSFFQYMDDRAASLKTNVMILPQFGSSGHPDLNYNMSGTICGLKLETTQDELYLALKECMLHQLHLAFDAAKNLHLDKYERLVMTGGAAKSILSAELRSGIFQKQVSILKNSEAGTVGCMILAAVAIGAYPDVASCIDKVVHYAETFLPDKVSREYYDQKYNLFRTLYDRMHDF